MSWNNQKKKRGNFQMTTSDIYDAAFHNSFSTKKVLAEWLTANDWRSICGVTLTLKQGLRLDDQNSWVRLDENRAKDAFQHFMHRLNKCIYGKRYRDRGQKVRVIPILEKGERWHYHIAIEPPPHINADEFAAHIRYCWSCVDWAYGNVDIKKVDEGWITNYLLKNKNGQKDEFKCFTDSVDILSLHL
jgi:hypothetical protein